MVTTSIPLTKRTDDTMQFWLAYLESNDLTPLLVGADYCVDQNEPNLELAFRAFAAPLKLGKRQLSIRVYRSKEGKPQWIITTFAAAQSRFRSESYRHSTIEVAAEYIGAQVEKFQKRADEKAAKQQQIANAKATWVNPHKVGDLLYHSWGYDQTNYDFAQIVAVGPRSVTIRMIGCRTIRDTGFMSSEIAPVKDAFLAERFGEKNEPKTIAIQFRIYQGQLHTYLPGWSTVGTRETFHETHYA